MSRTGVCLMLAASMLLVIAPQAQARFYLVATDFATVDTMDENVSQANAIDREESGNTKSLSQFKTDVAAAYAADLGGVCTWGDAYGYQNDTGAKTHGLGGGASGRGYNYFDSVGSGPNTASPGEKTKLLYGTSQTKALQCVPSRAIEIWSGGYPGWITAVSGPSYIANDGGTTLTPNANGAVITPETNFYPGDNTKETLNFTGLTAGENLKELGFVLVSSSGVTNVDVWVDYADATSSAVRTVTLAAGTTVDDVFVYFAATTSPIVALHFDSDTARPGMGDLGFIVGSLTPEPSLHPGDANGDGVVDLQDFGSLKDAFGATEGATWAMGDFNKDGAIDLQDFGILKDHFGHTNGDTPVTAVPEPATLSLLALAGLGLLRRRK